MARIAEAKRRHDASARLSSAVLRNGVIADGRGDRFLADFLKQKEPSTWLASVDSDAFHGDSDPRVAAVRDRLKRADAIYVEGEKAIASSTIQFVGKVRDVGLAASCAAFLDAALSWAPDEVLRASKKRSFLAFGEAYVAMRVVGGLGHGETLARMQADPASLPPALVQPTKAAVKDGGPSSAVGRLEEADRLQGEGKTEAAIAAFQLVLDRFPRTPESGVAQARINILRRSRKPPSATNPGRSAPRG